MKSERKEESVWERIQKDGFEVELLLDESIRTHYVKRMDNEIDTD